MQAAASGATLVFGWVAFWYFTNINIIKQILSVIFIIVNFIFLYVTAKKCAVQDFRPYNPTTVSKTKGALFGCAVSALNIIFMIIFRLLWIKFGTEAGIQGALPTAYNVFFYYWSYPYNGIMNLENGIFTIYSAIAMIVVPVAATASGYIAGCKGFDMADKLSGLIYEKDDE